MIAGVIDHTFLKTSEQGYSIEQQEKAIRFLINEADKYGAYSVCVRDHMVGFARQLIDELNSSLRLTTVIGFPRGDQFLTQEKISLVKKTRQLGADEYDMVMRYEDFKAGDHARACTDIVKVSKEVGCQVLKVILENAYFAEQEKRKVNEFVVSALEYSADGNASVFDKRFLKTSTGFARPRNSAPIGATIMDVKRMYLTTQGKLGIKAAGGVSDYFSAIDFFKAAGEPYCYDKKTIDPMKFRIGSSSLLSKLFCETRSDSNY